MKQFIWILVSFLCFSPKSLARFSHLDADEIDQEEVLNSESYNDATAYRFSSLWNRSWDKTNLGYRVSAGSLNANKSLIVEDIKLQTDRARPVSIGYERHRNEDLLERRAEQELRLNFSLFDAPSLGSKVYTSVLADGGHFKKWSDLGLAVGVLGTDRHFSEIYYESVDHFYNTKETGVGDRYSKKPWSVGLKDFRALTSTVEMKFFAEFDAPMQWNRPTQNYDYEYARQNISLEFGWHLDEENHLTWKGNYENKEESRQWFDINLKKKLERKVFEQDVNYRRSTSALDYNEFGLRPVIRKAEYAYSGNAVDPEKDEPGELSPNTARQEVLAYWFSHQAISDSQMHCVQYGTIANHSKIGEGTQDSFTNEVKFQFAYEHWINETSALLLNTNWDVDYLATKFPYSKNSFHPWDGGDIQIMATF